jgi:hypothetical protein
MRGDGVCPDIEGAHLHFVDRPCLMWIFGRQPDRSMWRNDPATEVAGQFHRAQRRIEKLGAFVAVEVSQVSRGIALDHRSDGSRRALQVDVVGRT